MVRREIPKVFSGIRVISHNPGGPNLGRGGKSMSVAETPPAVELGKKCGCQHLHIRWGRAWETLTAQSHYLSVALISRI